MRLPNKPALVPGLRGVPFADSDLPMLGRFSMGVCGQSPCLKQSGKEDLAEVRKGC